MPSLRFILVSLCIMLTGCMTQTEIPRIPNLTTESQKACARECQKIYSQCNTSCSQMTGGAPAARQREQCLDNCNIALEDCYGTCR